MLEEQGNTLFKQFLWWLAKKTARFTSNRTKTFYTNHIKRYKTSRTKLLRRNPNQGIHHEKNLSKEKAKYIAKQLQKNNQPFSIIKNGNEFEIITVNSNKSLVEYFIDKYNNKPTPNIKSPSQGQSFSQRQQFIKQLCQKINNYRNQNKSKVKNRHQNMGAR